MKTIDSQGFFILDAIDGCDWMAITAYGTRDNRRRAFRIQQLLRRPFFRNLLHKLFSGNQLLLNQKSFASASVCARLETRSSSRVTGLLSGSAIVLPLLNHPIRPIQHGLRDRQADLLGGF